MNNQIFFTFYNFAHQSCFLDKIVIFFAEYLPYILIIAIIFYAFWAPFGEFNFRKPFEIFKRRSNFLLKVFIPAVVGWLIADILKSIVNSPRPFILFKEKVDPLFVHGGMDSFPSGHATFFIILALGIFSINKKYGYIMFLFALIIGVARIISGIHFPVDIICGYILGTIIFLVCRLIFNKNKIKSTTSV